jgi:tRNA(Arg) A34 adenosine deaminase TadA
VSDLQRITEAEAKTGKALLAPDDVAIPPEEQERHRLYLLLLMRLVRLFWNGNKRGPTGAYPYRKNQLDAKRGVYDEGKPFLGHNIAAIAVDGTGKVVDFDFNHNEIFRSSMEHAEARLLRRMFSLTGVRGNWSLGGRPEGTWPVISYSQMLNELTVYTSLEPCAQCVGIMALARIKQMIYLQPDDGSRRVANVLYNLAPYSVRVRPIEANRCGRFVNDQQYGENLKNGFERFAKAVVDTAEEPFFTDGAAAADRSPSLTSFLCTDAALDEYQKATEEFQKLDDSQLRYPDYAGTASTCMPNRDVVKEIQSFAAYAESFGNRGTPH